MTYFVIPSRRLRQPQGEARPHPYWLGRGLVFLFNGASFVDHVTGIPAINSGGVGRRANANGTLGPDISGTQYLAWASTNALNVTGDLSIVWRGTFDALAGGVYRTVVSKASGSGSTNTPFECYADSTVSKYSFIRATGSGLRYWRADTTVPTAGVQNTLFISSPSAIETTPTIYVDTTAQSLGTSGSGTGASVGNTSDLRIGRRADGGTQLDGSVEFVAIFNQQLTADEYLRIYRNPYYELFAPDIRKIYFGVGATGGGAYEIDAQPGGYAVNGTAATLARGLFVNAQPGAYAVNGTAATLARGYYIDAQPGTYAVNGTAATLARGLVVNAGPGALTLTGTDATLEKVTPGVYTIDAQPGSFALTGIDATLTYTPLNAYTLDAQPATFTISGTAATLVYAGSSIWTDISVSATTWGDVGGATSIWTDL